MSPIMMALLGLLAYKAIKGGGLGSILGSSNSPSPSPPGTPPATGGGLNDILGSILGGGQRPGSPSSAGPGDLLGSLLGGAAVGNVLNGGLGNLLKDLQRTGHGREAQSWVGQGDNEPIAPTDLADALGADTVDALSQQSGLPRDELLYGLSQNLPDLVNQLTPQGRLPTDDEAARW
jgi:uncharacterized protein YidB (DUF937 family)